MNFFGELGAWPNDQLISFWWQSASSKQAGAFRVRCTFPTCYCIAFKQIDKN